MARARSLKPGFFANESLADLGPLAHILFAGLWTIADREGRLEDRAKRIKRDCLPYYDCDVDALLDLLASGSDPFIQRYEVDGLKVIQIVKWQQHQSPHVREPESALPACPPKPVQTRARTRRAPVEPVGSMKREGGMGNGESEKRESGKGSAEGMPAPLPPSIDTEPMREVLADWFRYKAERKEPYTKTGLKQLFGRLVNVAATYGIDGIVSRMQRAMASGWKGWEHEDMPVRGSPANGHHKRAFTVAELLAEPTDEPTRND